jgi:hypothetical protein
MGESYKKCRCALPSVTHLIGDLLMQKALRTIIALDLILFVGFLVAWGSPLPHLGNAHLERAVGDWWLVSTGAALILFVLRLISRVRGKEQGTFWLDTVLLGTWCLAFAVIVLTGASAFAGF